VVMLRAAKFADLPRLYELLCELHASSRYADVMAVDEREARSLLMNAIRRHGGMMDGGTCVYVSERDGQIDGFIIGMLDRVYHIGTKLAAKDMFAYSKDGSFSGLVDMYLAWASSNKNVIEINLSWTDAVSGAERSGALYSRKGFRKSGEIFARTQQ
jgi:hypothetical protein